MTIRNCLHRITAAALCACLLGAVPYAPAALQPHTQTLYANTSACACPSPTIAVQTIRRNLVEPYALTSVPYIAQASLDELDGILKYACKQNPTADKSPQESGQNTKSNVAITLLRWAQNLRPCRSFYFKLEPYADADNVWEVCLHRTTLRGQEEVLHTGLLHDYNTQTIYTADGTGVVGIGYDFNFDFDTFYAADDPWQRNFGFCKLYDFLAATIGDFYTTLRIPFEYDGKVWMIQLWKGIYSGNMLGGEIGLYNKPAARRAEFYDCATDPEHIGMAFRLTLGEEEVVKMDEEMTWWQTAFTYHKRVKPNALTLSGTLRFPNAAMAKAFAASLRETAPQVHFTAEGTCVRFTW